MRQSGAESKLDLHSASRGKMTEDWMSCGLSGFGKLIMGHFPFFFLRWIHTLLVVQDTFYLSHSWLFATKSGLDKSQNNKKQWY
jgi:hypothetical protein